MFQLQLIIWWGWKTQVQLSFCPKANLKLLPLSWTLSKAISSHLSKLLPLCFHLLDDGREEGERQLHTCKGSGSVRSCQLKPLILL